MHFFKKYSTANRTNRWHRWRLIFDLLEDRHVVPISEIVRETGTRPSVVEKDIETLCDRGLVKRTAKGGLTLESFHAEKTYEERSSEDREAKDQIAKLAVRKYVQEGMSVFLDGSTTVKAVTPYIANMKLRVITNSLSILADLREFGFPGELICVGGHFRAKANTLVGSIAHSIISNYTADMTLLGVEGVSSNMELMEAHPAEALVKQAYVENSKRIIVLAMPHKLDDDSLLTFATLDKVEALISTRFPESEFSSRARAQGVRLECPSMAVGA